MPGTFVTGPFRTGLVALCLALTVPMSSCVQAAGAAPTQEIVEKTMKATWDKAGGRYEPKVVLTVDKVRFGAAYKATAQEVQVEGIPEQDLVTPAVIDFTVRTYNSDGTHAVHRSREARVYLDKMGDWAVVTGQVKGEDTSTVEPAGR